MTSTGSIHENGAVNFQPPTVISKLKGVKKRWQETNRSKNHRVPRHFGLLSKEKCFVHIPLKSILLEKKVKIWKSIKLKYFLVVSSSAAVSWAVLTASFSISSKVSLLIPTLISTFYCYVELRIKIVNKALFIEVCTNKTCR